MSNVAREGPQKTQTGESLSTMPMAPQGWTPTEDPSQVSLTVPSIGGIQVTFVTGLFLNMIHK